MQFDESKPEPIVTPDTPNRTKFNPDEAPNVPRLDGFQTVRQQYRLMFRINRGTHIRSHHNPYETWTDEQLMRRMDNLAVFDAISSQMDMPRWLKRWARKLFARLDLRRYRRYRESGMGAVLGAIAVCAYACYLMGWPTHPNHRDRHPELVRLMDELGITEQEFSKLYGRAEQELRLRRRYLT